MSLTVGKRLALGFGVIIALMLVIFGLSISRLEQIGSDTDTMLNRCLKKERLVQEWSKLTSIGARRTTAIARSSDTRLEALFADETKAGMARAAVILKEMDGLLDTPEEKAMLEEIKGVRTAYLKVRDAIAQAKREQRTEEADRLFEDQFKAATATYLAGQDKLLKYEQDNLAAQAERIQSARHMARASLLAGGLATLVIAGFIGFALTRSIVRPVHKAVGHAVAIGARDLSEEIVASGDDEVQQLIHAMGDMQQGLRDVVSQVRTAANQVSSASGELAQGNADLSSRTEQQAASLEETASSMRSLTSTVRQNATDARDANKIAAQAAVIANKGGAAVERVVSTMTEIAGFSKRIQDIIAVIDGIAFQTNILALNAAVEAARAGEQGRGFAVVAAEVRTLAQRSAEAAREIKQLITESVAKVDSGVELVHGAGGQMREIVKSVNDVTGIVGRISVASEEQVTGIGQVEKAVSQMDKMTQQNAALVEEAAAAARTLENHAKELAAAVEQFKLPSPADSVAMVEGGWDGVERRGPDRATNVTRISGRLKRRSAQS